MGCDYYTQIITRICYRNDKGGECKYDDEEERVPHYIWAPTADPDFDEPCNPLDDAITQYGIRTLFADGKWLCQPAGKERILTICKEKNIKEESIVRVYKVMTGWWR